MANDLRVGGIAPETRTITSSRARIVANGTDGNPSVIGVISQFNPKQGRNVDPVRGIGFGDQIQELVPGMSEATTISITRTALYVSNIFQVFGYKGGVDGLVRALKHHKWPFDITEELVISNVVTAASPSPLTEFVDKGAQPLEVSDPMDDLNHAVITLYLGSWMTSYSKSIQADQAIVSEDVEVSVTDLFGINTAFPGATNMSAAEVGTYLGGGGASSNSKLF